MTERENYLLAVIRYLDDMDPWFLDQAPDMVEKLRDDYGWEREE